MITGRSLHTSRRLALALCVALGVSSQAAAQSGVEYQVKAAFIFNFLSFTQWPETAFAGASAPLHVCVFHGDQIAREISATVRGENIAGHPVVVEQIAAATDAARCHLLFVPKTETPHTGELLSAAKDSPTLTVGESDQFFRDGGIVNFSIENGRIRFDVNRRVARDHGLNFSSKLLQIARSVK